ncbi:MAG: hypothetical protein NTV40_06965 [Solirubrobacterales bacterium]|nr:hypothetical protein [Solirubrobacterales bacterium]
MALVAAALVVAAAAPGAASADPTLEVGIEDNNVLFKDPNPAPTIARWKALGVDNVRVMAIWGRIAPSPTAANKPIGFIAANNLSAGYQWGPLDRAVDLIRKNGMTISLTFLNFGPLWASEKPALGDPTYKPKPSEFAAFAYAGARRYRGKIKRVLVGNEPNQRAFLKPQFECKGSRCVAVAAHHYRRMVLAAVPAIRTADPDVDVLIGDLAPIGGATANALASTRPLPFLRDLGCVDSAFKPITTGLCKNFVAASADGFGYHPYQVKQPPAAVQKDKELVKLGDLDRLFGALDRLTADGRLNVAGGTRETKMDLYLTEFGYETNPPDLFNGVTPSLQSRYLQQSAYIAWATPRVKLIAQYVWRDEPITIAPNGKLVAGFQSGLLFVDGSDKPSLASFANPLFADFNPKKGGHQRVWGQARAGGAHVITLERSAPGSPVFAPVAVRTTTESGYWTVVRRVVYGERYRASYKAEGGSVVTTAPFVVE